MKATDNTHKACENCKHFIMHFTRNRYTYLVALGCGECLLRKITEEEQAKLPFGVCCDRWEQKPCSDIDKAAIIDRLTDISAQVHRLITELSK